MTRFTEARSKPVWVWLPDALEPVRAGVFTWKPGLGRFKYDEAYRALGHSIALDPLHLPWTRKDKGANETANQGVFGVFRDASPEGFGLALLERKIGQSLDELDRLEHAPGDAVGAIDIADDLTQKLAWRPPTLERLAEALVQLPPTRADGAAAREVAGLPGTSVGGERPKITVESEGHWWIAKLQDRADIAHYPAREYVAMQLASQCGIGAAVTRFHRAGEREFIAVLRFDRSPIDEAAHAGTAKTGASMARHGFASAHTVLHLGRGEVRGDLARTYPALAHELRRWCGLGNQFILPMQRELWRRMAFNALIGNGDDHPRNHAVVYRHGRWGLSPAYDVVPHPKHGGTLAMGITPEGDAIVNESNLLRACSHFGYDEEDARLDLQIMASRVLDGYESVLRETGFECADIPDLADSFALARELGGRPQGRSFVPSWERSLSSVKDE